MTIKSLAFFGFDMLLGLHLYYSKLKKMSHIQWMERVKEPRQFRAPSSVIYYSLSCNELT